MDKLHLLINKRCVAGTIYFYVAAYDVFEGRKSATSSNRRAMYSRQGKLFQYAFCFCETFEFNLIFFTMIQLIPCVYVLTGLTDTTSLFKAMSVPCVIA